MSKSKVSEQKLDSLQNAEAVLNHQEAEAHFEVPPIVERANGQNDKRGALTCKPSQPLETCPTNLDLTSPKGKALAFNAVAAADYELTGTAPTKITAHNYLAFPAEVVNPDTGEVSQVTFVALFDDSGKFLKTTSDVVAGRVASALTMYSPADWKAGIHFVLSPKVSPRSKRTYHDIRIDLDAYK